MGYFQVHLQTTFLTKLWWQNFFSSNAQHDFVKSKLISESHHQLYDAPDVGCVLQLQLMMSLYKVIPKFSM